MYIPFALYVTGQICEFAQEMSQVDLLMTSMLSNRFPIVFQLGYSLKRPPVSFRILSIVYKICEIEME